ncbi:hypothetical protein [Wenyingzhuangia aestuarii]|uniref:hypothetical protein n=1 Tax=Wenyingzhuangia aestuarii TaxID=1647582 RepID=UPI00143ABBF5|nr:hypothetical protein [Wenyingzhuangia aestuarii]NJB84236.1 hypothetical protein [Wenyingzhuangia aestuarii]
MLKYLYTLIFFIFFNFSFSQNFKEIEKISKYVQSIEKEKLKEIYHVHSQHNVFKITKSELNSIMENNKESIKESKNHEMENIGGSYLEMFSNKKNELTLVEHNDGINDNYFIEKYYYLKDLLVFCSIQKNLWEGQKLLWKSDYYFINEKTYLKNSLNKSGNKVYYIKEMDILAPNKFGVFF